MGDYCYPIKLVHSWVSPLVPSPSYIPLSPMLLLRLCKVVFLFLVCTSLKITRPPGFFLKPKLKENGVQTAKCIVEGEVWGQAWLVKPLSANYVNTMVSCSILITSDYMSQVAQRKLTRTQTRNRKLTLCT